MKYLFILIIFLHLFCIRSIIAQSTDLSIKSVIFYYSWPSVVNGSNGNVQSAIEHFSKFNIVVLGDGIEHPNHGDHTKTKQIITQLNTKGIRVFGYVDMGVTGTGQNLSISTAKTYVDEWKSMGISGIFWDEVGYDYGVTRERQKTLIDYCHEKGLNVFLNPWIMEDVLGGQPSINYINGDLILLESWGIQSGNKEPYEQWKSRGDKAIRYAQQFPIKFIGLGTSNTITNLSQDPFYSFIYWGAAIFGLEGVSYTFPNYSATGAGTNTIVELPTFSSYGKNYTATPEYLDAQRIIKRNTDTGSIISSWDEPQGFYQENEKNLPTSTPTITPTPKSEVITCACVFGQSKQFCHSSCHDGLTNSLEGYSCISTENCSDKYNRTIGDSTGDKKVCLDDYVLLMNAFRGLYLSTDENFYQNDFNGNYLIDDTDMRIFGDNYRPDGCSTTF